MHNRTISFYISSPITSKNQVSKDRFLRRERIVKRKEKGKKTNSKNSARSSAVSLSGKEKKWTKWWKGWPGRKGRYCYKLLLLNAALRRKKRARVVLIKRARWIPLGCLGTTFIASFLARDAILPCPFLRHKPAPINADDCKLDSVLRA